MARNLVLIGMMGAGKSAVGRTLARELKWEFRDLDDEIEAAAGMKISQIFSKEGEEEFRRRETEALRSLEHVDKTILATGGGCVTRAENWPLMRAIGPVLYLEAPAEALWARLKSEVAHRPILTSSDDPQAEVAKRLAARESFYRQADHTVNTSELSPTEAAQKIAAWLNGR